MITLLLFSLSSDRILENRKNRKIDFKSIFRFFRFSHNSVICQWKAQQNQSFLCATIGQTFKRSSSSTSNAKMHFLIGFFIDYIHCFSYWDFTYDNASKYFFFEKWAFNITLACNLIYQFRLFPCCTIIVFISRHSSLGFKPWIYYNVKYIYLIALLRITISLSKGLDLSICENGGNNCIKIFEFFPKMSKKLHFRSISTNRKEKIDFVDFSENRFNRFFRFDFQPYAFYIQLLKCWMSWGEFSLLMSQHYTLEYISTSRWF